MGGGIKVLYRKLWLSSPGKIRPRWNKLQQKVLMHFLNPQYLHFDILKILLEILRFFMVFSTNQGVVLSQNRQISLIVYICLLNQATTLQHIEQNKKKHMSQTEGLKEQISRQFLVEVSFRE